MAGGQNLIQKVHYEFSNTENLYTLGVLHWKARGKEQQVMHFRLEHPLLWGNFSRPNEQFFTLTVNGIPNSILEPNFEAIQLIESKNRDTAGCIIPLNFDGAKFRLQWYVREKSPVLWLRIEKDKTSVTPVKKVEINIYLCPGFLVSSTRKGKMEVSPEFYGREGVTPKRVLQQIPRKFQLLNPGENSIVFRDKNLSGNGNTAFKIDPGPAMIIFERDKMQEAAVRLDVGCQLKLNVNADFQDLTLGFYQQKNPITNNGFEKMIREKKTGFILERSEKCQ